MFGYLIDMDGVVYRENHLIPGAAQFIRRLQDDEIPFLFPTNNSQRTRRDVTTKLRRLGIDVGEEHVFTCAMATARFLADQKPHGTAYVIGEGGLLTALHTHGYSVVDRDPDYVVIGEGRTMSFENVEAALGMILGGAKLVATNPDPNCPTGNGGTRPGCGAIVAMLEAASGRKAFSVGKPSPIMMRAAIGRGAEIVAAARAEAGAIATAGAEHRAKPQRREHGEEQSEEPVRQPEESRGVDIRRWQVIDDEAEAENRG